MLENIKEKDESLYYNKIKQSKGIASPKTIVGLGIGGVLSLFVLATVFGSFFTVDQKDAAVVTKWGKYEYIAQPGLHFKIPFAESTTLYTTATQQVDIEHAVVNTADNQKANITLLVQYDIPPAGIKIIYEKYPNYEQRIYSLASDTLKIEFGKYEVMDIPSKRGEIEMNILTSLSKEAKRLYGANITEVQIKDVGYTDVFEQSIDRMTKAKADVEQATQERLKAKIVAEQAVVVAHGESEAEKARAEGTAASIEIQAKANADKVRMEGEAQASAIKAQTDALNTSPQFVNYTIAKTWDGKLPQNIGVGASSGSIPLLNIGGIK